MPTVLFTSLGYFFKVHKHVRMSFEAGEKPCLMHPTHFLISQSLVYTRTNEHEPCDDKQVVLSTC